MILSAIEEVEDTPIDRYLREQGELSAVERFSQRHDETASHTQARYYRDLLPATSPGPGQQYAFDVDLDACTGCKSCVAACHSLNGLDEDESWRAVAVLHGGTPVRPWQQTVTSACHHCIDPACLNGCPVDAYEKSPITGIVKHLDDQCIGCGYCTLTCPYEVPVFNHQRGIVRKCDMCSGRLAVGEAPACVQSCPNGAIRISVIDVHAAQLAALETTVPGGPPSNLTIPTTTYRSAQDGARFIGGRTTQSSAPARSHLPLVIMLVLTQLSVGAFATGLALRMFTNAPISTRGGSFDAALALATGALALLASVFHLGRPRYAYRAIIGIRHSWLSREVVAFGAFTGLAAAYAGLVILGESPKDSVIAAVFGILVVAVGLFSIMCSVFVYAKTRRAAWRTSITTPTFLLTAAVCGLASVLWASLVSVAVEGEPTTSGLRVIDRAIPLLIAVLVAVKLVWESSVVRREFHDARAPRLRQSFDEHHRARIAARFGGAALGGVLVPLVLASLSGSEPGIWLEVAFASIILVVVTTTEFLERILFFEMSSPPQ